jgi:hypothetical protein
VYVGIQKRRYFDTVLIQAGTNECEFNSLSVWRGFMPLHLYKHFLLFFSGFLMFVQRLHIFLIFSFFKKIINKGTNMVIKSSHAARRFPAAV